MTHERIAQARILGDRADRVQRTIERVNQLLGKHRMAVEHGPIYGFRIARHLERTTLLVNRSIRLCAHARKLRNEAVDILVGRVEVAS